MLLLTAIGIAGLLCIAEITSAQDSYFDGSVVNASETSEAAEPSTDANPSAPARHDWTLTRGAKEVGFEFGVSPTQPTFLSGHEEYDTAGRKFAFGSFRLGRVIGTVKGVTYQYFFEVVPVSYAIKNEVRNEKFKSSTETPSEPDTIRKNTYSFAVQPAGFRFVFLPKKRLKPFVKASAGFIFSRKPIPVPESPNYNFAADFGAGIMYHVTRRHTINFGYRYFHISNMNIGEVNPGYNANVFYFGYSVFTK